MVDNINPPNVEGKAPKNIKRLCLCRCTCGSEKLIRKADLVRGKIRSCGCFKTLSINKNEVYGFLTVLEPNSERSEKGVRLNLCKCKCGNIKLVSSSHLKNGDTVSCGCYGKAQRLKAHIKHGLCKREDRRTYNTWTHMIDRCYNKENINYHNYGGRGIKVCDRWLKIENFIEDMGYRPKGTSIDKINNNGNYEPGNCRWATNAEQSRNKRTTVFIEFEGKKMCIKDWAKYLDIDERTIQYRLKKSWPIEMVLNLSKRQRAAASSEVQP